MKNQTLIIIAVAVVAIFLYMRYCVKPTETPTEEQLVRFAPNMVNNPKAPARLTWADRTFGIKGCLNRAAWMDFFGNHANADQQRSACVDYYL